MSLYRLKFLCKGKMRKRVVEVESRATTNALATRRRCPALRARRQQKTPAMN
ncbi:unnamed protein product [Ciceribacter sp. T2.26MG-112.2]|nr:unnamed protein product [Ciceribacter naphthalenivorans]